MTSQLKWQFSFEKDKEVERIKKAIMPIIDSCKNEFDDSFCPYFCPFHGWCHKLEEQKT